MTRITRQIKYYKLKLKYPENITHNSKRTSYTHLHTSIQRCSCNFLVTKKALQLVLVLVLGQLITILVLVLVMSIVLGLVRMYFYECFVQVCE